MDFTLKLDMPDAEQEAVWLQERLLDENIEGLHSEVVQSVTERGAMSGGMGTELINLAVEAGVGEAIKAVIGLIFEHFKGKPAKLEFKGRCSNNGQEFTMTIETQKKDKGTHIAEFNALLAEFCGDHLGPQNH